MTSTRCNYSHDVSDETRFPDLDGTWKCPREAVSEAEYCLFHTPPTHSVRKDESVVDAFLDHITNSTREPSTQKGSQNRFIGSTLPSLDLSYRVVQGATTFPIDLRDATVRGDVDLQQAEIAFPMLLDGATIRGELRLQSASLERTFRAHGTTISGGVTADDAVFSEPVTIGDARLGGPILLRDATFEAGLSLQDCSISGKCVLHGATIDGPLRCTDTEFRSPLNVERVEVTEDATFDRIYCRRSFRATGATVHGRTTLGDALIEGSTQFTKATFHETIELPAARLTGRCDFRHITVTAAIFDNVSFEAPTRFDEMQLSTASYVNAYFGGEASFTSVTVSDELDLRSITLTAPLEIDCAQIEAIAIENTEVHPSDESRIVSLAHSTVADGMLQIQPDSLYYDTSSATLGSLNIYSNDQDTPLFEGILINHTTFDGFDFSAYEADLRETNWRLHTTADSFAANSLDYSAREKTYLKAKNGAERVGSTQAAAEFFRRELLNRRHTHSERASKAVFGSKDWTVARYQWLANRIFEVTAGYGERPRATIQTTFATTLAFAGLYWLLLPTPPYDIGVAGYLLFSLASFVTLVFGGVSPPSNPVVQFLAQLEGLLGAFLIALFVFTLTRSVHR